MLKKIDKLVFFSYVGPFVVTFFIALFILVMQFLWVYIDDLIGKGLETIVVIELLLYASASMVSLALPLAVLLSSIMTFGNLGEYNELLSMKAAGASLFRIMRVLIITSAGIAVFAFFFNNYGLPYSNLKFRSLLYDIRQQKPAINIKQGVFYNGFEGYSLRINQKSKDNKRLYDIMIFNHTDKQGTIDVTVAEEGEMLMTADKKKMILKLYCGYQYQELPPKDSKKSKYEHVRVQFDEYEKIFDLSAFKLERTDEELFKSHYQMMNIAQLANELDTLLIEKVQQPKRLREQLKGKFYFFQDDTTSWGLDQEHIQEKDSLYLLRDLEEKHWRFMLDQALNRARNSKSFVYIFSRESENKNNQIVSAEIEWHRKFTLSIACMILFFVGGPLGAIIRKGGFGLPIVFAVGLFVVYHIISVVGEKSAKEGAMEIWTGMWLPSMILFPVGMLLTYRVMYDSAFFKLDYYIQTIRRLRERLSRNERDHYT